LNEDLFINKSSFINESPIKELKLIKNQKRRDLLTFSIFVTH